MGVQAHPPHASMAPSSASLASACTLPSALKPGGRSDASGKAAEILDLLKDVTGPRENAPAPTTLEYHGQWQPKPNGAETGHGEVPKDWAIELASDADRKLATFDWAGGAQLCLSNAFRQVGQMEAQAQDLIESGTCTEDDSAVQCIRTIARAAEEKEAVMRRQWSDIDFHQGEDANKELLRHLERDFAGQLASTARRQGQTLKEMGVDGTPWTTLKMHESGWPGKVYLSAKLGGEGLELVGYDDDSGRQRWLFEQASSEHESLYQIRLLGGAPQQRRLLGRGPRGRLELCENDDLSGRYHWRLAWGRDSVSWAHLEDPNAATSRRLGCDDSGMLGLFSGADANSNTKWTLPGLTARGGGSSSSRAGPAAECSTIPQAACDDVVAIAARSGADAAVSLRDLDAAAMTRAIGQNRNLGAAIDLVGAYLKNYEIDKADRVCARIEALCRERGGLWLLKLLNFYSTVRMKQSRYEEALDMYKEYETLIKFSPEEAWEVYDTVYRNFGWIHTSLGDYDQALSYFQKAVEVKRRKGVPPHWFDQWDLGKTQARLALRDGRVRELELALQLIKDAHAMHLEVEPRDIVMRCKMLNSAGECAFVFLPSAQSRGRISHAHTRSS
eukprot:TRINITY_DN13525_c0_g1_i2.p1 TRINITY_DN13525_c0_g1~~TRINITY_DN13525_c0_g1_i2.p1  ORF type:complete len:616 (+),score=94.13 TRINITY_DN13525_c0_g1_i2:78-1925(+)